jgi:predicted component of type VI protein secretion system
VALLEILKPAGRPPIALDSSPMTIGRSPYNDLAVADDTMSRHHAVIERVGAAWVLRDLNPKNGIYVNGGRLFGDHVLKHADEVQLGGTRLLFRDAGSAGDDTTRARSAPPTLTATEHQVLVELCRPIIDGNPFTAAATVHEIAQARYVTDAAIKAHLGRLYDKFAVDEGPNRRNRLANAAIETGAVRRRDLDPDDEDTT